jgi:apolipoprotein N-acyltransferase
VKVRKILFPAIGAALLAGPYLVPGLFPLAWIAFVPLFTALDRAGSTRAAVFYGWVMGLVAHLIGFYWLVYTISVFGGLPYPVSALVFVIYAALQAVELALFGWFIRSAGLGPLGIFAALFWVPLEFLFPLLFPWHLANSQTEFSWFVQTADLVGPYGASFIVMWINAAIYLAWRDREQSGFRPYLPLAYASLGVAAALVYGAGRLRSIDQEMVEARKVSVAAVQGNVDIDLKWNPDLAQKNLNKHRELTTGVATAPLVIWPESAVEAFIPEDLQALPSDYMPLLESERAFFIFGAKSYRGKPGQPGLKMFNTAFLTDAHGRILSRYHKQVLLAFGEYLPFSKVLSLLPAMPFADGFTPGPGPVVFHIGRGVRVAPLICYEDLMPELSRKFVGDARANLLVNLTNDAWYGRSVGPWQHLWLAQSRAIETRRTLLRATNTGVTSVVNAKGEIVQNLPMFTGAVMQADVEILNGETYYVRFGDWFAWTLTAIAAAVLLLALKRSFFARSRPT